jgi:glycosyltransferase involved in cell wall biosynthesis
MRRPAVLVGNPVCSDISDYDERVNARQTPRLDYLELARRLNAELIGQEQANSAWQKAVAWTGRMTRLDLTGAAFAAKKLSQFTGLLSLSEKVAIPVSLEQALMGVEIPHTVIAHKLSSGWKTHLFRTGKLVRHFSQIICVSQSQAHHAVAACGMPHPNVHFAYDKVDHHFYEPRLEPRVQATKGYALAVGKEQRDYKTLLSALQGTDLSLIVVASSPWSTNQSEVKTLQNVSVLSNIPYTQLRALYAGARLVIVPLKDVDYAAGANGLLEAMSMACPTIVTRTRGLSEYIVPNETARFVEAGDVDELRDAVQELWNAPIQRNFLGTNARQAIVQYMNFDRYVDRITQIVAQSIPCS